MTVKKVTIIAAAGALLLAGAIGISIKLTQPQAMEMEVAETDAQAEDSPRTLENMENIPLYYNDREILLLPLRNVMEGLGGTVTWDAETRQTEISYRGKKLLLRPGETEATLNGYEITLPKAAEMINGCLYADEEIISAYYTGDVLWDTDSGQIILQAKDHTVPIVASKQLTGTRDGRSYEIAVPVVVGVNDARFEQNLNAGIRQELLEKGEDFLQGEAAEDAQEETLRLELHTELVTQEFLSFWWDGAAGDRLVYFAKNIDLIGQKTALLSEMVNAAEMTELRMAGGEGWSEESFYMAQDGTPVLLTTDENGRLSRYYPGGEDAS